MRELVEDHIREIQNEKVDIAHKLQFPLKESERKKLKEEWNKLNEEQAELARAID